MTSYEHRWRRRIMYLGIGTLGFMAGCSYGKSTAAVQRLESRVSGLAMAVKKPVVDYLISSISGQSYENRQLPEARLPSSRKSAYRGEAGMQETGGTP